MRQVLCDLFGEGVWDSVRDRVEKEVEEEKRRLEEKAAARIVSRGKSSSWSTKAVDLLLIYCSEACVDP